MKKLFSSAAVLAAVLAAASALLASEGDRTIPMPKRDESVKIGFASGSAKIVSVRIQHYPSEEDIQKAKEKPGDTQLTFWNFSVENRGSSKVRMKIEIEVIGKDGSVVGRFDKSDNVDAGKYDDNIRVWVKMKTLDILSAKSAKLHLSIEPK